MKLPSDASPHTTRAARLHQEARNCLAIAVGQKDGQFAAELIDEALRLTRRARELAVRPFPNRPLSLPKIR